MSLEQEPLPVNDALVDKKGMLSEVWAQFLQTQFGLVFSSPANLSPQSITEQNASIGTTSLPLGSVNAGLYGIRVYAQITTVATTSSSLAVTIGWTSQGQTLSQTFPALTGNSLTTFGSGSLPMIFVDAGSAITYSTTYASNAAGEMKYNLWIYTERLVA